MLTIQLDAWANETEMAQTNTANQRRIEEKWSSGFTSLKIVRLSSQVRLLVPACDLDISNPQSGYRPIDDWDDRDAAYCKDSDQNANQRG